MKQIKYSYCLNENNELIHIKSVSKENRHIHSYHCLECGNEMIAKIGKIKVPHFAHKADTTCNGESYLHKLAKRRIMEKFNSTDRFPLIFIRDVPCVKSKECPFYYEYKCFESNVKIEYDLKCWKGNVIYDSCKEETIYGNFKPDILLTCSSKQNRKPVFIEIYKTHKSEEEKLCSENRIIETMKIKEESDIDDIIERGFIEGENCNTFNCHPVFPVIKRNDVPIKRFVLNPDGSAFFISSYIKCGQIHKKAKSKSLLELNMMDYIEIWEDGVLDSYQKGLVYAVKKGFNIKNCILCRFHKYNDFYCRTICTHYKSLGEKTPITKQSKANTCPHYTLNQKLMNHSLSDIEKDIIEVKENNSLLLFT